MSRRTRTGVPDFSDLYAEVREYADCLQRFAKKPITACRVVEIGYGTRPRRLFWLANLGVDVVGIDLDRPVSRATPGELLRVVRQNGWERALKTLVRLVLFDRRQWRGFAREVERVTGRPFRRPDDRLLVGNAAAPEFWARHRELDFIYSEDVFEHIPRADLERIVAQMASSLKPDGLAFIRPCVFTGITGGHALEWYGHTHALAMDRRSEPWEHLRRDRFPANTYLNRLTRADYRALFAAHFDILEERVRHPNLGRRFLTAQIATELAAYGEEELFSNEVLFLLRPKRRLQANLGDA